MDPEMFVAESWWWAAKWGCRNETLSGTKLKIPKRHEKIPTLQKQLTFSVDLHCTFFVSPWEINCLETTQRQNKRADCPNNILTWSTACGKKQTATFACSCHSFLKWCHPHHDALAVMEPQTSLQHHHSAVLNEMSGDVPCALPQNCEVSVKEAFAHWITIARKHKMHTRKLLFLCLHPSIFCVASLHDGAMHPWTIVSGIIKDEQVKPLWLADNTGEEKTHFKIKMRVGSRGCLQKHLSVASDNPCSTQTGRPKAFFLQHVWLSQNFVSSDVAMIIWPAWAFNFFWSAVL